MQTAQTKSYSVHRFSGGHTVNPIKPHALITHNMALILSNRVEGRPVLVYFQSIACSQYIQIIYNGQTASEME
ncbi:hypothetical protein EG68_00994 [Paragonimus skrjabini miyazakii]|uniref:Uncharacterized protein n=1 Tax=Paragonimus skrjabini miyazakii TaxID=59628 RepID=A0A8S9ZCB8_9TREM|nr:hypothetical protein EG68_00994 [Paragonimus skrjabini miyazakii]